MKRSHASTLPTRPPQPRASHNSMSGRRRSASSSLLESHIRAFSDDQTRLLEQQEYLELALSLADLSIKSIADVSDGQEKLQLRNACNALLDEAERAKRIVAWQPVSVQHLTRLLHKGDGQRLFSNLQEVTESSRALPKSEEILLWRGSKLNGHTFPPWQADPAAHEFDTDSSGAPFIDACEIPLSLEQQAMLRGWKRPDEALPPPNWSEAFPALALEQDQPIIMKVRDSPDLVQDASPDCSVVASLCTGIARGRRGHTKILSATLWPYDIDNLAPRISPNGKYVVKLNFNGCYRKVIIDDRLPVSKTARMLHVVDRNNPSLLWPALLEKAYLKVRGGYDFPGSNSGTDIWVLLGWIPEQIFLQHEDTDEFHLWERLKVAHEQGEVLVTLGTGPIDPHIEDELGLAGDHDYAVLDIVEIYDQRLLLVKNPWLKSTSWKGGRVSLMDSDGNTVALEDTGLQVPTPGAFWIPFTTVMVNFQTCYLNWAPAMFPHRQDFHFTWDLAQPRTPPVSFVSNPQYTIRSDRATTVWILLSRHFTDRPANSAPAPDTPSHLHDHSADEATFISLYAFADRSTRVYTSKGATINTLFVDAPQTLLRLDLPPNVPYTIVPEEEHLPPTNHTFSLFVFSSHPLSINPTPPPYTTRLRVQGEWTIATAGGPATSHTFSINPQYRLTLSTASRVTLFLQTLAKGTAALQPQASPSTLPIQINMAHSGGERLYSLPRKALVASSGTYAYGCTQASTNDVIPAGSYTIVASTHTPGITGAFELYIDTESPSTITPIPREGAGRFKVPAEAHFKAGETKIRAAIRPARLCSASFVASTREGSSSALRLSVEIDSASDLRTLSVSGAGEFAAGSVRTGDVEIKPGRVPVWLTVERVGGAEETVDVIGWCEADGLEIVEWRACELIE